MVTKCIKGHFQPLLLFYANPDGSAITPDDASKKNSSQPQYKMPVNGEVQGMMSVQISLSSALLFTSDSVNFYWNEHLNKGCLRGRHDDIWKSSLKLISTVPM